MAVERAVRELLATQECVTSASLQRLTGLSRQAVSTHLRRLADRGELERHGAGRGTHYRRRHRLQRTWPLRGLEEDRVWRALADEVVELSSVPANVRSILEYSCTEMVNNAIDHSGGDEVTVTVDLDRARIVLGIRDDGIGALEHVKRRLDLEDPFAALQQIAKGKTTTAPEAHTGEGIFFTSKVVDVFTLAASGLRWTVDNARGDQAVGAIPSQAGTLVRLEVDRVSETRLDAVFSRFTDEDQSFTKSSVTIKLYGYGVRFISRSEAKRVARGLERFAVVELDFAGVEEVGQGFVDELLRVWPSGHPGTRLEPINMSPVVAALVTRGLPRP